VEGAPLGSTEGEIVGDVGEPVGKLDGSWERATVGLAEGAPLGS